MAGQGHKFGALQSIWQDAPTTFGLPSPLPSVLGGEGGSDDTLNRKTAKRFHSSVKQTVETTHIGATGVTHRVNGEAYNGRDTTRK